MSWHPGEHCRKVDPEKINADWENVKGELTTEQAGIWWTKFLATNPYFAMKFLAGVNIYPVQDILVRTWFQRDLSLLVAGRGFGKSFVVAIFIILYALFNPGVKIIICSGSYRQAKMIFETIENIISSPKATFLRQCCPNWGISGKSNPSKGTDRWEMKIGTSRITATPLTEKIRGYRAQVVIIDEFLAVPKKIVDDIIMPFLTVLKGNQKERSDLEKAEDILIARGEMQEWERKRFQNNKMIALSSATYKFEPLYQATYEKYLEAIMDPNLKGSTHSVIRMGYKLAPPYMDLKFIEQQQRSISKEQFDREYNAIFTDSSGGFFNIRHIMDATVPYGEEPKIRMIGKKGCEYIISIDPNSSAGSDEADNFAMSVFEMQPGSETGVLVHGFAHPKLEVKKKVEYLHYLMKNFNVVFIILDNAGGPRFLEEYNSLVPKEDHIFLADLDFTDDETFRMTRQNYNKAEGKIAYSQIFNKAGWIREANETLQGDLQHKKIMFASSIRNSDADLNINMNFMMDKGELEFADISDDIIGEAKRLMHVEKVDEVVETTAKELSLIIYKVDAVGNAKFELPKEVKAAMGKDRARRDSYTSFFMGNWGRRLYLKLISDDEDDEPFGGFFVN